MDGEAQDDGRQGRIVALLVSLACLAERAAGRCFPIRFVVFLLLSRAEAVARDHVEGVLEAAGLGRDDPQILAHAPDSASLAIRFRLLAGILEAVLAADLATTGPAEPHRVGWTWPATPLLHTGRDGSSVGGDLHASFAGSSGRTVLRGRPAAVTGNRPRSPPKRLDRLGRCGQHGPPRDGSVAAMPVELRGRAAEPSWNVGRTARRGDAARGALPIPVSRLACPEREGKGGIYPAWSCASPLRHPRSAGASAEGGSGMSKEAVVRHLSRGASLR